MRCTDCIEAQVKRCTTCNEPLDKCKGPSKELNIVRLLRKAFMEQKTVAMRLTTGGKTDQGSAYVTDFTETFDGGQVFVKINLVRLLDEGAQAGLNIGLEYRFLSKDYWR